MPPEEHTVRVDMPRVDAMLRGDLGQLLGLIRVIYGAETVTSPDGGAFIFPASVYQAIDSHADFDDLTDLDPAQRAYLEYAEDLFDELLQCCPLDDALSHLLSALRTAFLVTVLCEPLAVLDVNHACRRLFDLLQQYGMGWYGALGKSGELFHDAYGTAIGSILQGIRSLIQQDPLPGATALRDACLQVWEQALLGFESVCFKEQERLSRLEKRVCETEAGMIRAKVSDHRVVQLLNGKLAGRQLPRGITEFFHGVWRHELRLFLIRSGSNNEVWLRWQKLLETLAWVFKGDHDETSMQRLYQIAPQLVSELESAILAVNPDFTAYHEMLSVLQAGQISVLRGQMPICETVPPLLDEHGGVSDATMVVSQSLVKRVQNLQSGLWFIYRPGDGEVLRCKLAVHIDDMDQFLFVNRNGQKVMQKSSEEFAFYLSTNILRPLSTASFFAMGVENQLRHMAARFDEKQRVLDQAREKAEQDARRLAAERAAEEVRRRQEEHRRWLAAEKARREAEAIAKAREEARLLAEAEAALQAECQRQEAQAVNEKKAKLTVDCLNIGGWVSMTSPQGDLVKAKLAVKMASSGKFIFVDGVGIKLGEYQRQQLIEMVRDGLMQVLDQGGQFEDRLARVVQGLRKDKNG